MVWLEEKEGTLQSEGTVSFHVSFHFTTCGLSPPVEVPPVPPLAIARVTWSSHLEKNAVSSEKAAEFQLTKQNTSIGLSDCPVTLSPNFETLSSQPSMTKDWL